MVKFHKATRAAAALTIGCVLTVGADTARAEVPILSEARIGVSIHDSGGFSGRKEEGIDVNTEVLFHDLGWFPRVKIRPHVGASINTKGDTSAIYAGLTASFYVWRGLFLEVSGGAAAHNGKHHTTDPNRKELGCTVLFRESFSAGYEVTRRSSVAVYLDHISNANICSKNEGMETLGVRYGYRF